MLNEYVIFQYNFKNMHQQRQQTKTSIKQQYIRKEKYVKAQISQV